MKRSAVLSASLGLFALCGPAWALLVLEPGYTVETFTEYSPAATPTYSMTFDDAGNLYLNQPYDNKIWRVMPDGAASEFVSLNDTTSGLVWTGGTAYGDYLYVTANRDLVRTAPDGTMSVFASGFPAASEVAVDISGNYGGYLYVSTGGSDHIYRVDTAGGVSMFSDWPGSTSGGGPIGLEFDSTGDYGKSMYVATYFGQSNADRSGLFVLDTAGNASRFCDTVVAGWEIGFDATGLFDCEMFVVGRCAWDDEYSIWRVSPEGTATEFAATADSTIGSLVFGPDGAMYVAEYVTDLKTVRISRVIPELGTFILLGSGALGLLRRRKSPS